MPDQMSLPFQSLSFTLVDERKPRAALRMKHVEGNMYELHVEKGSAANPISQFTREVPIEVAQRLKDSLQEIGVFGWVEQYGNVDGRPSRRWTLVTVFKEDVFTLTSKGGSDVPAGFDLMLEELYRIDFPRPVEPAAGGASGLGGTGGANAGADGISKGLGSALGAMGMRGIGGLSAGDLGAYGAAGSSGNVDLTRLAKMMGLGGPGDANGADGLGGTGGMGGLGGIDGLPDIDPSEMGDLLSAMQDLQGDPQALQQRMRDEFRHMSPDEQSRLLDALASSGMASRAWWERFLRGL